MNLDPDRTGSGTLLGMPRARDERPAPQLQPTAIIGGLLLAVVVGLGLITLGASAGAPALGLVAPIIGCACGGFLAGTRARTAGLYHGAFVGAGWIGLEAFGVVPTAAGQGLATLQETLAIIVIDVLLIIAAMCGGFAASRN